MISAVRAAARVARPLAAPSRRCLRTSVRAAAAVVPTPKKQKELAIPDPMEVFETIDTNGDGVLSKEEFLTALEQLSLDELVAISKSLSRNELSATPTGTEDEATGERSMSSVITSRLTVMADVTVSKIFPAGFGWQMFSVMAENAGHKADELSFFLYTGAGDFCGVWTGHFGFSMLKKAFGADLNPVKEAQTGLLLATAAFCSGFVWQPTVNVLQGLELGFNACAGGTVAACGTAFFVGLRLGRFMYGSLMEGVEAASYANLKADVGLSLSIGGATGCFVGTDVSFGDANWLRPVVGIEESFSDMLGQVKAGTSTALGFVAFQGVQTFVVPKGKCWVD